MRNLLLFWHKISNRTLGLLSATIQFLTAPSFKNSLFAKSRLHFDSLKWQSVLKQSFKFWKLQCVFVIRSTSNYLISEDDEFLHHTTSLKSSKLGSALLSWCREGKFNILWHTPSNTLFSRWSLFLTALLKNAVWCMWSYGEWIFSAYVWLDYTSLCFPGRNDCQLQPYRSIRIKAYSGSSAFSHWLPYFRPRLWEWMD